MAEKETGISESLDEILEVLNVTGLSFSVIEPDGVARGWVTTVRNINLDGSASLWFGLRLDGEHFRFDVPEGQVYEVWGGECLLLRLHTEQEVKAYLLGNLLGFTGQDVQGMKEVMRTLTEDDPYRRVADLHKLGWCPIWNDWQHYFTERRSHKPQC